MALDTCIDCKKEMSSEAANCPHCGRPGVAGAAAKTKRRSKTQAIGLFLMLFSFVTGGISPGLGFLTFIGGFAVLLAGLVMQ